jgi:hypothetical protein
MYEPHPGREQPKDETLLWRYMDLAKFIAIIETQSLFFPRVTTLQDLDPFEGHPPRAFVNWLKANPPSMVGQVDPSRRGERASADLKQIRDLRKYVCASCWHANVGESAAMWSLYFHMTLEEVLPDADGKKNDIELQVPHRYVRAILYMADLKRLGFTSMP